MLIPFEELSDEALRGLSVEHITAGADQYRGNLDRDMESVAKRLKNGELVVYFSESDHHCTIKSKDFLDS